MHHPRLPLSAALWAAAVFLFACGGGETGPQPPSPPPPPPPPPPAPAPVASVTLDPATVTLVPQQTQALSATLRDAQGGVLSGRTITWTTDQPGVATVSASGLVTAVVPGAATITATSEGRSGTAHVTVLAGAVVGPGGGTVFLADSAIRLTIPAGALASPTVLTAIVKPQLPAALPAQWQPAGLVYSLGPDGTTFNQPVTVSIRYTPSALPVSAMTGDLAVLRHNGSQWSTLTDLAVDTAAKRVSGRTMGFSDFALGAEDPAVSLTPASASVNATHRSLIFTVLVAPRGEAVPLPPGSGPLLYRWRTTGQAGALSGPGPTQWTTTTQVQYTATAGALSQMRGKIDDVFVDVLLNPASLTDPTAGPPRIVTAQAAVDADLEVTYDIFPENSTIPAGGTKQLQLVVRDKQDNILSLAPNQRVEWDDGGDFGIILPGGGTQTPTATFEAFEAERFTTPPPRVEKVTARVLETNTHNVREYSEFAGAGFHRTTTREITVERGRDSTFITVQVDYQVIVEPKLDTIPANGQLLLEVRLDPVYNGTGLGYRYLHSGSQGSIEAQPGMIVTSGSVAYLAGPWGGGSDQVTAEVVSFVAGIVLAEIGSGSATIVVDPWRPAALGVITLPTPGGAFVAAQASVLKIPGASSYEISVLLSGQSQPVVVSWSGATTTNPWTVWQVLDGGASWLINIDGGFSTTPGGIAGRQNNMAALIAGSVARYRAQP
jgi:hypothetical protein